MPEGVVDDYLIGDRQAANGKVSPHVMPDALRAMVHEGVFTRKDRQPEMPDEELKELRSARQKLLDERAQNRPQQLEP